MAQEILLIRHGETDSNAARVVQLPGAPLSARGRDQARRLALRLAAEARIRRLVSSDLTRAVETADAIAGATGARVELEPLLQERNFGEYRGTPYRELTVDIFAPECAPVGGECGATFAARVDRAWARIREIAEETEGRVAVVTHGLVCHELARRHLACEPDALPSSWGNTSVTVVAASQPWRILRLACTAHLEETVEPGGRA